MGELFDDLFNDFFGKKKNTKKEGDEKSEFKNEGDNFSGSNDIFSLVNMLYINDIMEEQLGKPINIEYYEQDGMFFERKTWKNVNGGKIIKTAISDQPFKQTNKTQTLQELLIEAVNNEDYEEAARLRDKINTQKEAENQ